MIKHLFSVSLGTESPPSRVHLRGRIVTPTDELDDGTIVIENGEIRSVQPGVVTAPAGTTQHTTNGTIVAGFVDAHNHPECAAIRRWIPGPRFALLGRPGWRGRNRCGEPTTAGAKDPFYEQGVYRELKCLIATAAITTQAILYGQVRGVIGGATAMVLDANAASPPIPPSAINRGAATSVMTILDPGCLQPLATPQPGTPAPKPNVADIVQHLTGGGRVHVHCAEGPVGDAFCEREFDILDQNALLGPRTTLIHGLGLDATRLARVAATQSSMIWSPVSNINLYGRTLDAQRVIQSGVDVALAPDWTVSGSSTILDEARFALARHAWLRPTQALRMITELPASLLGLNSGRLAPGYAADIVVFGGPRPTGSLEDVVRDLLSRPHEAISLVMAAGAPVYGTAAAMRALNAAPTTAIHVPIADGSTVEREIALAPAVLASLVGDVRTALERDPAPWWEAP